MNAREIARGGLLAAAALALLYLGSISPYAVAACCIMAGAANTIPLIRHAHIRGALVLYIAVSVLALLFVPRKLVALAYLLFCGLYPIVKYAIECYAPRQAQLLLKLVYFNMVLAAAGILISMGLFAQAELPGTLVLAGGWIAANIIFGLYDVGMSRLIAALGRMLPPD